MIVGVVPLSNNFYSTFVDDVTIDNLEYEFDIIILNKLCKQLSYIIMSNESYYSVVIFYRHNI